MQLIPSLLTAAVLALPAVTTAASAPDCTALQAEVERLRGQVRQLESALGAAPVAAPRMADTALPGTAAKPEATAKLVIEEPYSRTGCRQGLFKGIAPAQWQDPDPWLDLEKGQSPAIVEKLLGVEHYDVRGGSNVLWEFGKCGASSRAQVLFTNGKLTDWRAPSR